MLSRSAVVVLLVFCTGVVAYWWQLMSINHGHFAYALDDAYIHMAIARHFVQDHVWSVSRYESGGASSSLLYTLLISILDLAFGVRDCWPFVLNVASALLLIVALDRFWVNLGYPGLLRWILFALLLIVVPLASQVFAGMEVMLQCAVAVLLVSSSDLLWVRRGGRQHTTGAEEQWGSPPPSTLSIATVAFLATAIRYEMVFLILALAIGLSLVRRYSLASHMLLAGSLPPLIYGVLSASFGGFFFPNTLLLKGNHLPIGSLDWLDDHAVSVAACVILVGVGLCVIAGRLERRSNAYPVSQWRTANSDREPRIPATLVLSIVFVITTLLHLTFSIVSYPSQFQRHHSYLIVLGILVFGAIADIIVRRNPSEPVRAYAVVVAVAILLAFPFVHETMMWIEKTAVGSKNIYEEHVQMSAILQHTRATAVVNDIGAVNYYTNNRIVDLVGLGSDRIARLRLREVTRDGASASEALRTARIDSSIAAYAADCGATLAMIYDPRFYGFHPPERKYEEEPLPERPGGPDGTWSEIGALHISNNFTAGQANVLIYATSRSAAAALRDSLRTFDSSHFPDTRLDIY